MSLRTQIALSLVVLVLALGLGGTAYARATLARVSREQLQERGLALARALAGQSADELLTDDVFALYTEIDKVLVSDPDVRYVLILDAAGRVRAHTFGRGLPRGLREANRLTAGQPYSARLIATEEGLIDDLAVPIFEGKAGVARVGLAERGIQAQIDRQTLDLLLITGAGLALGLAVAYVLATLLSRPLEHLAQAAQAVGRGDLSRRVPARGRDEVSQVGRAFNAMAEGLAGVRAEAESYQRQLLRQNEELAAVNAVARAVGASLSLAEILDNTLATVLQVMGLRAGWIFLRGEGRSEVRLVAHQGLSPDFVKAEAERPLGGCICRSVLASGETAIQASIPGCPRVPDVSAREGLTTHACVPLRAKGQVIGILNVAASDGHSFAADELRLLASIGGYVGVAIENGRLYEEVQRKEELRGQLLEKVIAAQEQERRRIARELHDESAQALTALLMAAEIAEGMLPDEAARARDQLARARLLTSRALGEIRRLIQDLRPSALDDLGLVAAIRGYAEERLESRGVEVGLAVVDAQRRLPPELSVALYRILQEAIANVARHAQASQVRIRLELGETRVLAVVEDDGRGFDVGQLGPSGALLTTGRSLGILGMQERAALLGGSVQVDSRPGRGTRLVVEVPLERDANGGG